MILSTVSLFIIHFISAAGYVGVSVLMAIESAAIPLPSEVIMPFAGSLVATGQFSLFGIALAAAAGSTIGSLILYYIGLLGGRPLVERYGKYVCSATMTLPFPKAFSKSTAMLRIFLDECCRLSGYLFRFLRELPKFPLLVLWSIRLPDRLFGAFF